MHHVERVELGGGGEVDLAGDGGSPWGAFDDCDWSEYWCHPHPSREMGIRPSDNDAAADRPPLAPLPGAGGGDPEVPDGRRDWTIRGSNNTPRPRSRTRRSPVRERWRRLREGPTVPGRALLVECSPRLMVGFLTGSGCICTVGVPGPPEAADPLPASPRTRARPFSCKAATCRVRPTTPRRPHPLLPHPGRSLRRVGRALRAQRRRGPGTGRSRGGRLLGDDTGRLRFATATNETITQVENPPAGLPAGTSSRRLRHK